MRNIFSTLQAMQVVFLTGIYPPAIGGPALYCKHLAQRLTDAGESVTVITYGKPPKLDTASVPYKLVYVPKWGGPLVRWVRYARAIKTQGKDADVVYAFSSISCGIPLILSRIQKPKKILRLGGDFFWERYTDRGGMLTLRAWYATKSHKVMQWVLQQFDHIVFSTDFQKTLYEESYPILPSHSVVENASPNGTPVLHTKHEPMKILFMGRFVGFKNLPLLLKTLRHMDGVILTLIGDGPMKGRLKMLRRKFRLKKTVKIKKPLHGEEKLKAFADHDLLILPSITEISPNVALEARAAGLPVLLAQETGLSVNLTQGMVVTDLSTEGKIAGAIIDVMERYNSIADQAARPITHRSWDHVTQEHLSLFRSLV